MISDTTSSYYKKKKMDPENNNDNTETTVPEIDSVTNPDIIGDGLQPRELDFFDFLRKNLAFKIGDRKNNKTKKYITRAKRTARRRMAKKSRRANRHNVHARKSCWSMKANRMSKIGCKY